MAQVFLSYDREDGAKARVIAQALERAGHFVWWDLHIKGGAEYGKVIEQALADADSVVVLWSPRSVDSAWVRDEAAAGRDSGRLIPVLLEAVNPPMGFRQYQNLDFTGWKGGRSRPPRMAELLESIAALGGSTPPKTEQARPVSKPIQLPRSPLLKWVVIAAAVMIVLVGLSFILQRGRGGEAVHTVAIIAADDAAKPLARDLLVNLARLQSARSGTTRLIGEPGSSKPDLIFEAASGDQGATEASLVLMDGEDQSVLWTRDFDRQQRSAADLKQQVAYTAARVLGCALEGLDSRRSLPQQTLKLYLNACADLSELSSTDPTPVRPALLEVIERNPAFVPAWKKLLLLEADFSHGMIISGRPNFPERPQVIEHIARAKQLEPEMPEARLAELAFIPRSQYAKRQQLLDRALQHDPDNAAVLIDRSSARASVGRTREGIEDARVAALLDPLSPSALNAYISALAYGGRIESAEQELRRAERLWSGTATLRDIQFRFHLRYGDPKLALEEVRSGGGEPPMLMFLEARANPTPQNIDRYIKFTSSVQQSVPRMVRLAFVLQGWGEFNRIEELYRELSPLPTREELAGISDILFRPALKTFRQDSRFMRVAQRAGLVDYWRESGKWPDFCADPDLPYDCKAEAVKVAG